MYKKDFKFILLVMTKDAICGVNIKQGAELCVISFSMGLKLSQY